MNQILAIGNCFSRLFGIIIDYTLSFQKTRKQKLENYIASFSNVPEGKVLVADPVTVRDALVGMKYCFVLLRSVFSLKARDSKLITLRFGISSSKEKSIYASKKPPVYSVLYYVLYHCGYKILHITNQSGETSVKVVRTSVPGIPA